MSPDDDLRRRARLCLRNVQSFRNRFARFFRYRFEGAEWLTVTNGWGVAFVRVSATECPELSGELNPASRNIEAAANWSFAPPIARADLFEWLERLPHDAELDIDGERLEPIALGVARGVVFERRLIRDWLAPFMDLDITRIVVSGNELDNRMLRVDGFGWVVIVMGRVEEPSDLPEPVAVCK